MRRWVCVGVLVATLAAVGEVREGPAATPPAGPAASAECSDATALQVGRPYFYDSKNTFAQLLCGQFTGPGSNAMAIGFFFPVCWPIQRWAVFSFTNGDWKLVLDEPAYLSKPLEVVGSDIRETVAVHRPGDARCFPTGGTRARIWHWDGTRLVAGAWTQVTPPDRLTRANFYSPSRNLTCEMDDGGPGNAMAGCQSNHKPHLARLAPNGRVTTCRCAGNFGEGARWQKLAYGKQLTVGRFRCYSLKTGVKCIVISSGKGFLINRDRTIRVG